jgi:signal transduction histidine kinase/CheY-like chemotaxis protein
MGNDGPSGIEPARYGNNDRPRPNGDPRTHPKDALITSSSSTLRSLQQIGFTHLLDQDLRPTFIIDLDDDTHHLPTTPLRPVFCNALLHVSRSLKSTILGLTTSNDESSVNGDGPHTYSDFASWARRPLEEQARDGSLLSITYYGILWKSSTVGGRWRIISGTEFNSIAPYLSHFSGYQIADMPASFTTGGLSVDGLVKLRKSFFDTQYDFTRFLTTHHLPPHLQLFRSIDWSSTPLGPIETWSSELRLLCNIVTADINPAVLFWGPESVMIYNKPYVKFLGEKHPSALGQSAAIALVEVWEQVDGLLEQGRRGCKPVQVEDALFCLFRHGYTEECYFSSTFLPLVEGEGEVVGFYESVIETTKRIVTRRRAKVLQQMKEQSTQGCSLQEFWDRVNKILNEDTQDVPHANLYAIRETNSEESALSNLKQPSEVYEYGSLGLDVWESKEDMISTFLKASQSTEPTILDVRGTVSHASPSKRAKHQEDRVHNPRQKVLLCPLRLSDESKVLNFFVMGVNPQRPLDEGYIEFAKSLSVVLIASLKSIIAAQESEAEQAMLEEQLRRRTLEVKLEETRFARLAESAPVAIWIESVTEGIKFRNEKWWEVTQFPRDADTPFSWLDIVQDRYGAQMDNIRNVLHEKGTISIELELRRPWTPYEVMGSKSPVEGQDTHAWVLCSIRVDEYNEDGKVKSVVGVMTEISRQKWAEGEEARRKEDALESKRQQEAFVDMVSHEVRNPLSAILISAEEIRDSLEKIAPTRTLSREVLASNLDAAGVIVQCALHQKRIVDDILSMSKLDSNLLIIAPVAVQPTKIVQDALNMLASEARTACITLKLSIEDSYKGLGVDWVLLDPSRLTQVLINLVTNAIKFTASRPKRRVTVIIAASMEGPSKVSDYIRYVSSKIKNSQDVISGSAWGTGEPVFIHIAVQDTGRGLKPEEKELLFQRFSQASPRTHVQYGGSGLGLFISRTLVEMQGGEIGVASESGVGSTFAFYILARRTAKPEMPSSTMSSPRPMVVPPTNRSIQENGANSTPPTDIPTAPAPNTPKAQSTQRVHVLIVEDNIINQTVLKKQLVAQKWVVHVANHGGEALDFLHRSRFRKGCESSGEELSVVLMDQEMPIMDGLTCVKLIRNMEKSGDLVTHVPIIAVTANARSEQVKVLEEAGMVSLRPLAAIAL